MKTSKMMKIINKAMKTGNTTLSQKDVKNLFGGCNEEVIEELKQLDCMVELTDSSYTIKLTRSFDHEEIKCEELLESFHDF